MITFPLFPVLSWTSWIKNVMLPNVKRKPKINFVNETVMQDFLSLVFFTKQLHLRSWQKPKIFVMLASNSLRLLQFLINSALEYNSESWLLTILYSGNSWLSTVIYSGELNRATILHNGKSNPWFSTKISMLHESKLVCSQSLQMFNTAEGSKSKYKKKLRGSSALKEIKQKSPHGWIPLPKAQVIQVWKFF